MTERSVIPLARRLCAGAVLVIAAGRRRFIVASPRSPDIREFSSEAQALTFARGVASAIGAAVDLRPDGNDPRLVVLRDRIGFAVYVDEATRFTRVAHALGLALPTAIAASISSATGWPVLDLSAAAITAGNDGGVVA